MGDTLLMEKGGVMMETVKAVWRRKKNRDESRFGNRYGCELKLLCGEVAVGRGVAGFFLKQGGGEQRIQIELTFIPFSLGAEFTTGAL